MKLTLQAALLMLASCSPLFGQTTFRPASPMTFRIEGTISSEWDSLPAGILIPRNSGASQSKEDARVEGVDDKGTYIRLPRTQITFSGKQANKTVVVDKKGFYQVDLPVGFYKMTAEGPAIGPQALKQYVRLFRVKAPQSIVLNGTLYKARVTCDAVGGGETEDQKTEEWKNICGGEDYFPSPSKDGTPFQLYIQYPQREPTERGHIYTSNKTTEPDVPVFVAYNLFSVEADRVVYDAKNRTIAASGNVVTADGSGTTHHADSIGFKIEDGQAIPLN
jgi:hypothetical protein